MTERPDGPYASFDFLVELGGVIVAGFSECSGLSAELDVVEYRGGHADLTTHTPPGLRKLANITLKRGVMAADNEYFDWVNSVKMNKVERRDIIISLLNEEHEPVMTWTVVNAWPTKITSPDLKASGNEAAIETLELAHEGVTIGNG